MCVKDKKQQKYIKSFKKNIDNIRYIPKKYITQEMCDKVIEEDIYNIRYIQEKYITQEMSNNLNLIKILKQQ